MSNLFALILIVGIVFFATGKGGPMAIPMMAVGAVGIAIASFMPVSHRQKKARRLDKM
jgi:hypothetical protein